MKQYHKAFLSSNKSCLTVSLFFKFVVSPKEKMVLGANLGAGRIICITLSWAEEGIEFGPAGVKGQKL